MKNLITEYMNGGRKATVEETVGGFFVTMYMDEKVISKIKTSILNKAEDIAEDYISTGQGISQFLSENING